MCDASVDDFASWELTFDPLFKGKLSIREGKWRLEDAIRKLLQSLVGTSDASESFNMVIPRLHLIVPNRPVDADTFLFVGFKVDVAHAIALSPPGDRSAT